MKKINNYQLSNGLSKEMEIKCRIIGKIKILMKNKPKFLRIFKIMLYI